MKKLGLAGIAIATIFAASAASAADLPRRSQAIAPAQSYAAMPTFTWTGFYAGLNAGWSFGSFNKGGNALFGSSNGGIVGGTVGYNYQFNNIVAGLEADWGKTNIDGRRVGAGPIFTESHLTSLMTVRGRLGYAVDRALVYGTFGYAGGNNASTVQTGAAYVRSESWRNGYALGAGIEYAFTNSISAKGEYVYTSLSDRGVFSGTPFAITSGWSGSVVRGGVNYHF